MAAAAAALAYARACARAQRVGLYQCHGVTDVSPLAQVPEVELYDMCNVTDISPLAKVRKVRKSGGGGSGAYSRACARAERASGHVRRRH